MAAYPPTFVPNPADFRVSEVRSAVRYCMLVVVGCDFSLGRRRYVGRVAKSVDFGMAAEGFETSWAQSWSPNGFKVR
ncbi:hypothetical protein KY284_017008 [Solanum tuberosum]|nr:hypothetical protein KY284_017008 [Solanum tuberosum]